MKSSPSLPLIHEANYIYKFVLWFYNMHSHPFLDSYLEMLPPSFTFVLLTQFIILLFCVNPDLISLSHRSYDAQGIHGLICLIPH